MNERASRLRPLAGLVMSVALLAACGGSGLRDVRVAVERHVLGSRRSCDRVTHDRPAGAELDSGIAARRESYAPACGRAAGPRVCPPPASVLGDDRDEPQRRRARPRGTHRVRSGPPR